MQQKVNIHHSKSSKAGLHVLDDLLKFIAKLPGLGPRSARRIALDLLDQRHNKLNGFIDILDAARQSIRACSQCANLSETDPCHICSDTSREVQKICVVEHISDLWAIERAEVFKGHYHILGGVLSALDGMSPETLNLQKLFNRCNQSHVEEVILATNLTIEGQTTAHYIARHLEQYNVKATRLAHGIPAGGELNFMDDGTLRVAMETRTFFDGS